MGSYNPDWAIVKHDGQALYLVRETKGVFAFLNAASGLDAGDPYTELLKLALRGLTYSLAKAHGKPHANE